MANSRKKDIKSIIYCEVCSLFIIALGLLMVISFFSNSAGLFGEQFKIFCKGLFGNIIYVFPFLIIAHGVHYFIKKDKFFYSYKYWFIFGLCIITASIIHIFYYKPHDDLSAKQALLFFYEYGTQGKGGGLIGGIIADPIINMFGKWGTGIIFVTCQLALIIAITEVSLTTFLKFIAKPIVWLFNSIYKKNDDKENYVETPIIRDEGSAYVSQEIAAVMEEDLKTVDDKFEKDLDNDYDDIDENISIPFNEHIEYKYPPIELLHKDNITPVRNSSEDLKENAEKLVNTLKSFGVEVKVLQVSRGPSVTRYELQPSAGVKVSKITNLADDIALSLAATGVRIEAPIPGKAAVGIEVPNKEVRIVYHREVIEEDEFKKSSSKLTFGLGKDITGKSIIADIGKMPHLLIAGATGSGKSVCINTLIISILFKANPNEVKLILIDPKVVELGVYNGIPHLLIPVVTNPQKAASALRWAVSEMENRYKLFAEKNVRDLKGYNLLLKEDGNSELLPQIVVIIDELSDLMMVAAGDVEDSICRLSQMARAAGIHIVIATQRPSVNVITGVIKANITSRISFAVSSQVDSRTILDMAGAEKLLGRGDMLFYPTGAPKPIRIQGAFISDKEVESVVEFIKENSGENYQKDIIEQIDNESVQENNEDDDCDELLPKAIEMVVDSKQASISMLQRRLKIGYTRAARIVDQMEVRGIVGGYEGSKPRQVLITKQQFDEMDI